MSLINDALKRVKDAQQQAPPSADVGPKLRPIEPVTPRPQTTGLLLPIALVLLSILTVLLVWALARKDRSTDVLTVRAEGAVSERNGSQMAAQPSDAVNQTALPAAVSITASVAATPATSLSGTATASRTPTNAALAIVSTNRASEATTSAVTTNNPDLKSAISSQAREVPAGLSGTNAPLAGETEPAKPAPLKLQGIVFSKRPSAVISGRTVFVGDRIREFRIAAITPETAVLTAGGRTNILSFSE